MRPTDYTLFSISERPLLGHPADRLRQARAKNAPPAQRPGIVAAHTYCRVVRLIRVTAWASYDSLLRPLALVYLIRVTITSSSKWGATPCAAAMAAAKPRDTISLSIGGAARPARLPSRARAA